MPPETSKFFAVDMGTTPPQAADALMGTVPNVMHQLGTTCQSAEGWTAPGEVAFHFEIADGVPRKLSVMPDMAANTCLEKAFSEATAALSELPDAEVLVRARFYADG